MPISKIAEYTLQPHQERVDQRLNNVPGLIAWHSLGSGKTLTALNAILSQLKAQPNKKVLCIVPAPLVENIKKEIIKHNLPIPDSKIDIMSYDKAVSAAASLSSSNYSLVVLDESHKLRETNTTRYNVLKNVIDKADKRLLLTGTVSYNDISNIAPLVGLASNNPKILPLDKREFRNKYVEDKIITPSFLERLKGKPVYQVQAIKDVANLKKLISPYIDYHNSLEVTPEDFPTLSEKIYTSPLSKEQHQMYNFLMNKIPPLIRKKIEWGLPLSKAESSNLNAFSTGVRQVSDSMTPYNKDGKVVASPKILQAVGNLKDSKAIVYSNYIEAGLKPYAAELDKRGISYQMFTGSVPAKQKAAIVNDFNNGDSKVLLLSSSGGEGIDLKGVRQVQILEPHFNKSKIDQVIGRAQRYKSHVHLPEDQRNVVVEHYHSLLPDGRILKNKSKSIDEYLHDYAEDKNSLTQELIKVIK